MIRLIDIKHGSGFNVDFLRLSGIYAIRNSVNGHHYVGSSNRILVRCRVHLVELTKGTHHCEPLQRAIAKYGIDKFFVSVLDAVDGKDDLFDSEQQRISEMGYYNTAKCSRSPIGIKHNLTDEDRKGRSERAKAMNKARTKEEYAEVTKKALAVRLQKPTSDETKAKLSAALKGREFSAEHLAKIQKSKKSNPNYEAANAASVERLNQARANMTDEQRAQWKAKLSATRKGVPRPDLAGRKVSEEAKAKISAARKGKPLSAAHRAAIAASWVVRKSKAESLTRERAVEDVSTLPTKTNMPCP